MATLVQKYRLYLRRLSGVSQHQSGLNNSFMGPQEAAFGPISSLNGLDLQTLAVAGQLPAQSLATLQAAGLGRSNPKSGIPMPLVDQRNLFSFEAPKFRYGEGHQQQQQQQQLSNSGKQINLLHGIPTNMEPKQLATLRQSVQPFGSINMQVNAHGNDNSSLLMQMAQPQSRQQILNETTGNHISRIPSSMGQPVLSNGMAGGLLTRNVIGENGRGAGFINPVSQGPSVVEFQMNHTAELAGNSFPLGTNSGMANMQSKGLLEEVNSEMKGSRGFVPSCDIFNELHQPKSQDWELQNVGLTFNASQHANNVPGNLGGVSPSVLVHQAFSSGQKSGHTMSVPVVSKVMFSMGPGNEHGNPHNISQNLNAIVDGSLRVKTEKFLDPTCEITPFAEHYGQEDLMSALLKQVSFGLCILVVACF